MNLTKKTDEWVRLSLLTRKQQADILAFENEKYKPFRMMSLIWLGILSLFLGLVSLVANYWHVIPDWLKLAGLGVLLLGGLLTTIYFFKKEEHLLVEAGLFFVFLMIGGGIGLLAQIFNLPMDSGKGLLLWAALSFVLVVVSRQSLLSLIWIPLFLGGILGYMQLELLLLFFSETPLLAVSVAAGILFGFIILTGNSQRPFIRSINGWSVVLYYVVLILGENYAREIMASFGVSVFFLTVLAWYAIRKKRVRLFNWTLFFVAVRLVILYFQVFESLGVAGIWLVVSGIALLALVGAVWVKQKRTLNYKSIGK